MSFSFNFFPSISSPVDDSSTGVTPASSHPAQPEIQILTSEDIHTILSNLSTNSTSSKSIIHVSDTCEIQVVNSPAATALQRDVISGLYEGGHKVWECTLDLCRFIRACHPKLLSDPVHIADIGCGPGVAGLLAMQLAPAGSTCIFQDLNRAVLTGSTAPTLAVALGPVTVQQRCSFIAGPWSAGPAPLHEATRAIAEKPTTDSPDADIVLSSETVYNVEYIPALLHVIAGVLAPAGVAILAQKRLYFGVGGGVGALLAAIRTSWPVPAEVDTSAPVAAAYTWAQALVAGVPSVPGGAWQVETLAVGCARVGSGSTPVVIACLRMWVSNDGASNLRELLVLKCMPY